MARPITGLTLSERYTDLGVIDVDITDVEITKDVQSVFVSPQQVPQVPRNLIFQLRFDDADHTPVPQNYKSVFTLNLIPDQESYQYVRYPNPQGFVGIDTAILPICILNGPDTSFINLRVDGEVDTKADECYLRFVDGEGYGYTRITDLVVHGGKLCVLDGTTYRKVNPEIGLADPSPGSAYYISVKGEIYTYSGGSWILVSPALTFYHIQFPEAMTVISDGFYSSVGVSVGTVTSGQLGVTSGFENFKGVLQNPSVFNVKLDVDLYDADHNHVGSTAHISSIMPGSLNINFVDFHKPAAPADNSPNSNQVQDLWPDGWSTEFSDFLDGLTDTPPVTLAEIRSKGPIPYITGYPFSTSVPLEVAFMQSHVDLYTFNSSEDKTTGLNENQHLIDKGYGSIHKIATTAKSAFLSSVSGGDTGSWPVFKAAQLHEVAGQGMKFLSSRVAAVSSDYQMADSPTPDVSGSSYRSSVIDSTVSACGCDDCQTKISPFAYLMDLIKYASEHVNYTGYDHEHPNLTDFFNNVMNPTFKQPFGDLNVSCDTLHQEFCRVRLVTEVLRQKMSIPLSAQKQQAWDASMNDFLMQTYQSLLIRMGTSWSELRDLVAMPTGNDRDAAVKRWCTKVGIPVEYEDPDHSGTYLPTLNRFWLFFNTAGDSTTLNELNLQNMFGYRSTDTADIALVTPTPQSRLEAWRALQLRELWASQDYVYSRYTREGVTAADFMTYNPDWLPVVDPDIIGMEDMTYTTGTDVKALWAYRKNYTDIFLSYYTSLAVATRTSADINGRILKVLDRNIVSQVFENDSIMISPSSGSWTSFQAISKVLVDTNTDVVLEKATPSTTSVPAMFQPDYGSSGPMMRYRKIVSVTSPITSGSSTAILAWTDPVIVDRDTNSYTSLLRAKLHSSGEISTVFTEGVDLTVSYVSSTQVNLTFTGTPPSPAFAGGDITFVYDVIVPLFTTEAPDHQNIISNAFTKPEIYVGMAPSVVTTGTISVWNPGGTWPSSFSGLTPYDKVMKLYTDISNGTATEDYYTAMANNLYIEPPAFNRLMQLLLAQKNYMLASFTAAPLTDNELWELASILQSCKRKQLNPFWIKEELLYVPSLGSAPDVMMLDKRFFWKSLAEPQNGNWDPGLQTLAAGIPMIDPELLPEQDLLNTVEAASYRSLYASRKTNLSSKYTHFYNLIQGPPLNVTGFIGILNEINTGSAGSSPYTPAYNISPYANLDALVGDLSSADPFKKKDATDMVWSAFAINATDFIYMAGIKTLFEMNDPGLMPNNVDLDKALRILVSGYKRQQYYAGWVTAESGYQYYNIRKMRLAPGRSDAFARAEWQQTLEQWNGPAAANPDIVPPEYILNFNTGDPIYTAWINQKQALANDLTYLAGKIDNTLPAGTLLSNLQDQIDLFIARNQNVMATASGTYYPYFTDIMAQQDAKADITALVGQLCMTITEFKYLRKIVEVLTATPAASASPLLDSECQDVMNILIAIRTRFLSFDEVQREFKAGILISQDGFELYKPLVTAPQQLSEPKFDPWRSPLSTRNNWEDTLQSRIDSETALQESWQKNLQEVEEVTMPLLRNACITAMANNQESFASAAERLAKSLLVETEDNCCVKHTRVSFAIETLQNFLYTLNSGIFTNYIPGFTLYAPYFNKEWEWLGSYATWRSAMFVFLYPENLLYPTLKRLQSPAFADLSDKLQQASSFSAEDACAAGKDFQSYLTDVENLTICCSVNADSWVLSPASVECCADQVRISKYTTFYFGQGTTGKCYWSYKYYDDENASSMNFWMPIDAFQGRTELSLLGCYVLSEGYDWANYRSVKPSLWLFYTYWDKGTFKMAYITKALYDPSSKWSDESAIKDLPTFPNSGINENVQFITACQHGIDWMAPGFIFSYSDSLSHGKTIHAFVTFNKADSKCIIETVSGTLIHYSNTSEKPVTAIRFDNTYVDSAHVGYFMNFVTIVFPSEIYTIPYGNQAPYIAPAVSAFPYSNCEILSCFESKEEDWTIIVYYKDAAQNIKIDRLVVIMNLVFSISTLYGFSYSLSQLPISNNQFGPGVDQIKTIYPLFTQRKEIGDCILTNGTNTLIGTKITTTPSTTPSFNMSIQLAIAPEPVADVSIESAECNPNWSTRAHGIMTLIQANVVPSSITLGHSFGIKADVVRELLYEAYYFVPMLLALDQQQRGQYDSALNWYRTVYNYLDNVATNRKIFYGLVLEDPTNMQNGYSRDSDWLLDPLNPHHIATQRTNAYTKYTLMNIVQCLFGYADTFFTQDTIESVPVARRYYTLGLELLQTTELKLNQQTCYTIADSTLNTGINITGALRSAPWSNMYTKMTESLGSYGRAGKTQTVANAVVSFFNNTSSGYTMEDRFRLSINEINTNRPADASQTVAARMTAVATNVNDAYRYVSAISDWSNVSGGITESYARSVASISDVAIGDLDQPGSASKISWLRTSIPDSSAPASFNFFSSGTGQQILYGARSFNPLNPTNNGYQANLNYSNANIFVPYQSHNQVPYTYMPLITFSFCMPQNPIYQSLQLKGGLELFKIFNCRNIAGMVRELDIYSAPTDSVTGMPVIGASGNLVLPGIGILVPSQYRFKVLIERAKLLVQQSQQLESLFLSSLEKQDAEAYNQLQAQQGLETARATVTLQDLRISQANDEKGLANLQQQKATISQKYFSTLIDHDLNSFEKQALDYMQQAEQFQQIAAVIDIASAAANFDSQFYGAGFASLASSSASLASALSTQASYASIMASYERRREEWTYQENLASKDVEIANQQVTIADDNIRIVTQERAIAQLNTDHAQASLDFLKNKFTNVELYRWMSGVLQRSYSYMLNLATSVARTAERQLYFERQEQAGPFIQSNYWQTSSTNSFSGNTVDRQGLTGSARLLVDITRLDQYAFDSNKRKLQMTKVISLGQNFPSEFQQFKETGIMNFQLTNKLFDYDFPGHYLRLINTVKTSVIGLLPVYDSIKATLSADTISYTVIGGTTFQRTPIRRLELDSVALTSPSNSTGMFDLQPAQGDLLNPFEGMGIESRWVFEMPQFSNRFDFSNIADVLITVEYTALDSYQYRYQVLQDLDNKLTFNKGFSFKNDFPDQWYELAQAESGSPNFGVTIELKREDFPQGFLNLKVNKATDVLLYFVRDDGFEDEIEILDFSYVNPRIINNPGNPPNYLNGTTDKGKFDAQQLTRMLNDSPVVKLQLLFDNNPDTRAYFTDGKVKDILLLMPCKAELKAYPL